jgi:hypothetical protein
MPLIQEIENALLLIEDMPGEDQEQIARQLSIQIVALDNARTMTPHELIKLTELAMADLARCINDAEARLNGGASDRSRRRQR